MSLLQLKREVKSWEKTFQEQHQRLPTSQDIKAVPGLGALRVWRAAKSARNSNANLNGLR